MGTVFPGGKGMGLRSTGTGVIVICETALPSGPVIFVPCGMVTTSPGRSSSPGQEGQLRREVGGPHAGESEPCHPADDRLSAKRMERKGRIRELRVVEEREPPGVDGVWQPVGGGDHEPV